MNTKIKDITDALVFAALCCSLMLLGIVPTAAQTNNQSSATLDANTQAVKNQIAQIGERSDITIIGKNKREFYGSIREIKDESVSINEIDQNAIVEIKYQDIKKNPQRLRLKQKPFRQPHPDPQKHNRHRRSDRLDTAADYSARQRERLIIKRYLEK